VSISTLLIVSEQILVRFVRIYRLILLSDFPGRAASGGASALELPRATRSTPEPIRNVFSKPTFFFTFSTSSFPRKDEVDFLHEVEKKGRVQPAEVKFCKKVEFSRLNSKQKLQKN